MPARLALLATVFVWLGYESHFSPTFFVDTVKTSVADILGGIDTAIAEDHPAVVMAAAKEDREF